MKLHEADRTVTLTLGIVLRIIVVLSIIFVGLTAFAWGDDALSVRCEGLGVVTKKQEIRGVDPRTAPRAANHGTHQKRLCIRIEQRVGCFSVSEDDYQMTEVGSRINVTYTIGTFTGDLHIKSLHQ